MLVKKLWKAMEVSYPVHVVPLLKFSQLYLIDTDLSRRYFANKRQNNSQFILDNPAHMGYILDIIQTCLEDIMVSKLARQLATVRLTSASIEAHIKAIRKCEKRLNKLESYDEWTLDQEVEADKLRRTMRDHFEDIMSGSKVVVMSL